MLYGYNVNPLKISSCSNLNPHLLAVFKLHAWIKQENKKVFIFLYADFLMLVQVIFGQIYFHCPNFAQQYNSYDILANKNYIEGYRKVYLSHSQLSPVQYDCRKLCSMTIVNSVLSYLIDYKREITDYIKYYILHAI